MDVLKQSRDYMEDRGILLDFPEEPIYDNEDEAEGWATTVHRERIIDAEDMETKLLDALQTARDEIRSVRDHADGTR